MLLLARVCRSTWSIQASPESTVASVPASSVAEVGVAGVDEPASGVVSRYFAGTRDGGAITSE